LILLYKSLKSAPVFATQVLKVCDIITGGKMASYATKLRQLYPYKAPTTSIDHLVIGGGVVGLSVAAGLVNTCGKDKTTFLVERRGQVCPTI
jgi:heterodisulfide reductase subunit A-like polyferredoxin